MASRAIADLSPVTQAKARAHLAACQAAGIDYRIYCTLRTPEEQGQLYAIGRTVPGKIVTNAKPGTSSHNYGYGYDGVPYVGGKPLWEFDPRNLDPIWLKVGELGEAAGLEWFGRTTSPFIEGCHFQEPNWRSLIK